MKLLILKSYISILFYLNRKKYNKVVSSSWWFNAYYKHTKKHKQDCEYTKNKVLVLRKSSIGR